MNEESDGLFPPAPSVHGRKRGDVFLMCKLSVANFGIQAAWALLTALVTPYFSSTLGASEEVSRGVWLCGPLSGLIVAPVVGHLSDTCRHKLGRRQPFILIGAASTCISMIAFAYSSTVLSAFIAFAMLDLSINTSMNPARALQADLIPASDQGRMQATAVVTGALGDFASGALIAALENPLNHVIGLCAVHAAVFVASHFALCVVVQGREEMYIGNPTASASGGGNASSTARRRGKQTMTITNIPNWLWSLGGMYALGFFSFFVVMPSFSTWLSTCVFGGDAHAPAGTLGYEKYHSALSYYGLASMGRSLLCLICGGLYPRVSKVCSARRLVSLTFGFYGLFLFFCAGTRSPLLGCAVISLYAVPLSVLATVPHTLAMQRASSDERARVLGVLAWFCCVPQLLDTTYTGTIARIAGEVVLMRVGAFWSILCAIYSVHAL